MAINVGFRILSDTEMAKVREMIVESVLENLDIRFYNTQGPEPYEPFTAVEVFLDGTPILRTGIGASLLLDLPNFFAWLRDSVFYRQHKLTPRPPLPKPASSRIGAFWPEQSSETFQAYRVAHGAQIKAGDVEYVIEPGGGRSLYVAHVRHQGLFPFFVWQKVVLGGS